MDRIQYFKDVLNSQIIRLTNLVEQWEITMTENNIPDEVCGKILSVTGQCKLLLNDKLQQFKNLINICSDKHQTLKITADDLQGFWDLVSLQIEDVNKKFVLLDILRSNGWNANESTCDKQNEMTHTRPRKCLVDKNLKHAAKLRLEAAKLQMKSKVKNNDDIIYLN